jgi:hypothetical protein
MQTLLDSIQQRLITLEQQKHAFANYYNAHTTISNEFDKVALLHANQAIQITTSSISPSQDDLKKIYYISLSIRKLSIIASILSRLECDSFLTNHAETRDKILDILTQE